jgi:hypothetical protein
MPLSMPDFIKLGGLKHEVQHYREVKCCDGNPIAPWSEGADAQNSGVSGEGAQDITGHYPNPKGA